MVALPMHISHQTFRRIVAAVKKGENPIAEAKAFPRNFIKSMINECLKYFGLSDLYAAQIKAKEEFATTVVEALYLAICDGTERVDHSWDGYHYHYENRHYLLTGFQQQKFTIKDAVGNERQCELMLDELESGIILKDIGNDNIIFEYNFPMFNSLKKNLAIAGEHATLLASLRFCNEANTAAPEENAQSTDSEETYSIYSEGLASRNIFKLRAAQRIVTAAGTDRYSQEVLVKASKFIAHMAPPEAEAAQHSQVGLMI